jgi:hypothetical protein
LLEGSSSDGSSRALLSALRGADLALTILGGLVAVIVLGLILQSLLGNFVSDREMRAREAGEQVTAASARRQAHALAQAGSYREAVRQLYLATLLSLEDRGLLRADRSLTNRELLLSVSEGAGAQGSAVQGALQPVVDVFESVWYGQREPDAGTFGAYTQAVDAAAEAIDAAELPAGKAPEQGAGNGDA